MFLSDIVGCLFQGLWLLFTSILLFHGFFVILRTLDVPDSALFILIPLLGLLLKYGYEKNQGGPICFLARVIIVCLIFAGGIALILKL